MKNTMRLTAYTVPVATEVTISPYSMIEAFRKMLGIATDHDTDIELKNDTLWRITEFREHCEQREPVTSDKNIIAMYNALNTLEKAYNAYVKENS